MALESVRFLREVAAWELVGADVVGADDVGADDADIDDNDNKPERPDNEDEPGGDGHVATDEPTVDAHLGGVDAQVAVDGGDQLHQVVDEADHRQHQPWHQQAGLALCKNEIYFPTIQWLMATYKAFKGTNVTSFTFLAPWMRREATTT